jgi:hypothetical protein
MAGLERAGHSGCRISRLILASVRPVDTAYMGRWVFYHFATPAPVRFLYGG